MSLPSCYPDQSFQDLLLATFVHRPNRFVIHVRLKDTQELCTAYCPNPGRMLEFLNPTTPLVVAKTSNATSKHPYQLVGVQYRDQFVPLHTGLANRLAEEWILPQIFPDGSIQPEVTFGTSRLDFVITRPNKPKVAIEVKNCSLVEQGVALFPDAPSPRASKHVSALAKLREEGWDTLFLIVVTHSNPRVFRPLVHTDPTFSRALTTAKIPIQVVSFSWNLEGKLKNHNLEVPVDLSKGDLATCGSGMLIAAFRFDVPSKSKDLTQATSRYRWLVTWTAIETDFPRVVTNPQGWFTGPRLPDLLKSMGKPGKQRFWTLVTPSPGELLKDFEPLVEASPWQRLESRVYDLGNHAPEWHRPFLDFIFGNW